VEVVDLAVIDAGCGVLLPVLHVEVKIYRYICLEDLHCGYALTQLLRFLHYIGMALRLDNLADLLHLGFNLLLSGLEMHIGLCLQDRPHSTLLRGLVLLLCLLGLFCQLTTLLRGWCVCEDEVG